ncbi:alpha/beta fold hydrolase [Brachybacterium sp. FME24]|uniref:alpha/beta fold hydrolase n=1 Tax=Brachybacterium sp. FME24 TaxID=2742605 RepID=UPI00186690B7|nr:alpha/beta hydrolase [Brachybacterium sp. FME24]
MSAPVPHVVRRGSGTPLLFLHGNGVDHRLLLDLDDVFAEQPGWERIYLDLPGFGRTPALGPPGGLPELARWVDGTVGSLLGSSPFAVLGSSLGGLLARDLAAPRRAQCLGLALLAPVVDPIREHRRLPERIEVGEDPQLLASLDAADAATYAESAVLQTPENLARFREAVLPGIRCASTRAMARLDRDYTLRADPDERLDGFERPVLIVAGKRDAVVGFEDQRELAARFPQSTYAALDQAGHNVHLDQPETVRTLLRQWSRSVHAAA